MKQNFYILEMWQTGNIGSHNVKKCDSQPKDGFKTYELAEEWLFENINKITPLWETFIISKVYSKI